MGMSRLARDGTAEPVSRHQILGRERGQGNIIFPCSADHEHDWQPYTVDPYSCYMCDHTYQVIIIVPGIRYLATRTAILYHQCLLWSIQIVRNSLSAQLRDGLLSGIRYFHTGQPWGIYSRRCCCFSHSPNRVHVSLAVQRDGPHDSRQKVEQESNKSVVAMKLALNYELKKVL